MARPLTSSKVSPWCSLSGGSRTVPDQAHAACSLQGKDQHKIGLFEIDVQFPVRRRPGRLHVRDVEEPGIGAAGKADGELCPDGGRRAIAACEIGGFAELFGRRPAV